MLKTQLSSQLESATSGTRDEEVEEASVNESRCSTGSLYMLLNSPNNQSREAEVVLRIGTCGQHRLINQVSTDEAVFLNLIFTQKYA